MVCMPEYAMHTEDADRLLLKAGEAQERLGISSRGQFSKLQPHLLSLVFAGVTYRFSAGYIDELRWSVGSDNTRYIGAVREFAGRPATTTIITEEIAIVRNAFRSKVAPEPLQEYIAAPDLREVAQLGRMTLFEWKREGMIHTFTPRGHHQPMHVSLESLNTVCEWHYPEPHEFGPGVQVI